jgi:hypothetical protein
MAYQVCQTTAQGTGMNMAYMQQVQKLLEKKREANPRKQMRADLSQFIVALREKETWWHCFGMQTCQLMTQKWSTLWWYVG